jgi:SAM-dependent methyltransferase
MWWDSLCYDWHCGNRRRVNGGEDLRMQDAMFETIARILSIPSIECQRIPGLSVVRGLGIAASSEVRSVLLVSKKPLDQIASIALDPESRTSNALARVLAADLSLSSLSYAKRKTRELGLTNIDYVQADLLALGTIGRSFDVIEAVGVLHHLRDPAHGWRVLISLLRPCGVMHVGLYSALARADIRTARAFIAERGYGRSAADIRQCRQDLLGSADGTPLKNVSRYSDFFTVSECRDLLFHVQEHQLTIPEIKAFLTDNNLTFLGFANAPAQAYRACFPHDPAMTDLDHWHVFETENPKTFVNMYQFWVQKPATMP